mgnify:CR=1 FL=1
MASAIIRQVQHTTLSLSEEETTWLSAMLQNPLHDEETLPESDIRCAIWHVLNPKIAPPPPSLD